MDSAENTFHPITRQRLADFIAAIFRGLDRPSDIPTRPPPPFDYTFFSVLLVFLEGQHFDVLLICHLLQEGDDFVQESSFSL